MDPKQPSQKETYDVESRKSDRAGISGLIETAMRSFRGLSHGLLLVPLYLVGCAVVATAATPGIWLVRNSWIQLRHMQVDLYVKVWIMGFVVAAAYLTYGFSMILIAPLMSRTLRCGLKEWRGPYYSLPSIRWYIHNGLTYMVRYTFLEFITPTPFNLLFYRLMGMSIGPGTVINTSHISDPSLIRLGKGVTIGGSVTIVGHYGQGGFLVLAPVTIGDRATIGLRATIMGGAQIGAKAKILPNSVVLPKTIVPDGETWGGVPAVKISTPQNESSQKKIA